MRQLDQLHNDMIWLSIVGVTDQYLQNHISHSSYAVCYTEILSTVMSLNLQDEESVGCIRQSCEPRLLLYRFWSLYESMLNSEYLVSKLQLTQSKSRWARLFESHRVDQIHVNELLTKAGISLHDSKQPFWFSPCLNDSFKYVSLQVRSQLNERLKNVSSLFHTDDLFYDSFVRRYGDFRSIPLTKRHADRVFSSGRRVCSERTARGVYSRRRRCGKRARCLERSNSA